MTHVIGMMVLLSLVPHSVQRMQDKQVRDLFLNTFEQLIKIARESDQ